MEIRRAARTRGSLPGDLSCAEVRCDAEYEHDDCEAAAQHRAKKALRVAIEAPDIAVGGRHGQNGQRKKDERYELIPKDTDRFDDAWDDVLNEFFAYRSHGPNSISC